MEIFMIIIGALLMIAAGIVIIPLEVVRKAYNHYYANLEDKYSDLYKEFLSDMYKQHSYDESTIEQFLAQIFSRIIPVCYVVLIGGIVLLTLGIIFII